MRRLPLPSSVPQTYFIPNGGQPTVGLGNTPVTIAWYFGTLYSQVMEYVMRLFHGEESKERRGMAIDLLIIISLCTSSMQLLDNYQAVGGENIVHLDDMVLKTLLF